MTSRPYSRLKWWQTLQPLPKQMLQLMRSKGDGVRSLCRSPVVLRFYLHLHLRAFKGRVIPSTHRPQGAATQAPRVHLRPHAREAPCRP